MEKRNWLERVRSIWMEKGPEQEKKNPMAGEIALWGRLYRQGSPEGVGTLRLPAVIASELARLAASELESTLVGSPRADYLQRQYGPVVERLRVWAQYGFACGGMVLKPYPHGEGLRVQCIGAEQFTPLTYDGGEITGALFTETATYEGRTYHREERHLLEGERYQITNRAYDGLGRELPLAELPAWCTLSPTVVLEGVKRPLFVYFRTPMANSAQPECPLGVSVYSSAVELIQQAEEQWERIQWEYKGSELAVDASEDLFEHGRDGSVLLPRGQERLFRAHDIDIGQSGGKFLEVFSPAIRDTALFNGLNNLLRRIEFNCGLAYGTLSDPQNVERTAEEIKAGKQRSYSTVRDLQAALEKALRELGEVLDIYATLLGQEPGAYTQEFRWGDSIITDSDTLRKNHREDVAAGLMTAQEYRHIWHGKETAVNG